MLNGVPEGRRAPKAYRSRPAKDGVLSEEGSPHGAELILTASQHVCHQG